MARQPNRSVNTKQDLGAIDAITYNDSTGTRKVMIVEPTIVRATTASENVGAGRLIKLGAAPYGLDLVGKAYDPTATYQQGDVVSEAVSAAVYLCQADNVTGTFDASQWKRVADKTVAAIPSAVGAIVSTGRWHNAITVAGFLVDDESSIEYTRIRD